MRQGGNNEDVGVTDAITNTDIIITKTISDDVGASGIDDVSFSDDYVGVSNNDYVWGFFSDDDVFVSDEMMMMPVLVCRVRNRAEGMMLMMSVLRQRIFNKAGWMMMSFDDGQRKRDGNS